MSRKPLSRIYSSIFALVYRTSRWQSWKETSMIRLTSLSLKSSIFLIKISRDAWMTYLNPRRKKSKSKLLLMMEWVTPMTGQLLRKTRKSRNSWRLDLLLILLLANRMSIKSIENLSTGDATCATLQVIRLTTEKIATLLMIKKKWRKAETASSKKLDRSTFTLIYSQPPKNTSTEKKQYKEYWGKN